MATKISWADEIRYNKWVRWVLIRLPVKWEWLTDFLYPDDAVVTFVGPNGRKHSESGKYR